MGMRIAATVVAAALLVAVAAGAPLLVAVASYGADVAVAFLWSR